MSESHPNGKLIASNSNLNSRISGIRDNGTMSVDQIFDLLRSRAHYIVGLATLVGFFTVLHHFFSPSYTANTTLLVQRAENSPLQAMMGKMSGASILGGKSNEYQDKYLLYLESHDFFVQCARRLLQREDLKADREKLVHKSAFRKALQGVIYTQIEDLPSGEQEIEDLARVLHRSGSFKKGGFDNIKVAFTSGDYHRAVKVVNFLAESALDILVNREISDLTEAKNFLEVQSRLAEEKLKTFDEAIINFRKNSKYYLSDAVTGQAVGHVLTLKNNIQANQLKIEHNSKLTSQLLEELQREKNELLNSDPKKLKSSDIINELLHRILSLRYQRVLLQAQGDDNNSNQLQSIDRSINQYAEQFKEVTVRAGGSEAEADSLLREKEGLINKIHSLKRENQYLSTQSDLLNKTIKDAMEPLNTLPESTQKLIGFNRGTTMEYTLSQEMKKRRLEIEIEQISMKGKIRIIEQATIAAIPLRLNFLPKFLIAVLASGLLLCIVAYALETVDTTIKDKFDLNDLGLIGIGSIPRVGKWWHHLIPSKWGMRKPHSILATWKLNSDSPEIMAFNHIRARILKLRSAGNQPAKVVAITSARPSEGKSFIAVNLALSLAQLKKKVILIDCDLRRSSLPEKLGISNKLGLSDILTRDASLVDCLTRDLVTGLDVLPAGPSVKHPTELISGSNFIQVLEKLKSKYDYVLMDTPPVLPVVDSIIVAGLSDALIFSVTYRESKFKYVTAALDKLKQMDQQVAFGVLNKVPDVHEYIYISTLAKPPSPANAAIGNAAMTQIDIHKSIKEFRNTLEQ